jgi:hypothetical protein
LQNLNNYAHCPLFFNGCHNSHGHIIFLKNSPKKHMQTLISTYYNITHLIANVQLPFYLNPTSMLCLMPIFHIFVIPIPQSQHDDPCFFIWMHITCHFHIFVAFLCWCTYDFFFMLIIQEMCIHLQVAFKCQLLDLPIEIIDIYIYWINPSIPNCLRCIGYYLCATWIFNPLHPPKF